MSVCKPNKQPWSTPSWSTSSCRNPAWVVCAKSTSRTSTLLLLQQQLEGSDVDTAESSPSSLPDIFWTAEQFWKPLSRGSVDALRLLPSGVPEQLFWAPDPSCSSVGALGRPLSDFWEEQPWTYSSFGSVGAFWWWLRSSVWDGSVWRSLAESTLGGTFLFTWASGTAPSMVPVRCSWVWSESGTAWV